MAVTSPTVITIFNTGKRLNMDDGKVLNSWFINGIAKSKWFCFFFLFTMLVIVWGKRLFLFLLPVVAKLLSILIKLLLKLLLSLDSVLDFRENLFVISVWSRSLEGSVVAVLFREGLIIVLGKSVFNLCSLDIGIKLLGIDLLLGKEFR